MATVKDVARRAGVSTGTVDRILHNRGRFSPHTAEKVFAAVKELGYEPNVLARNLSTSRTCSLAVFMPRPEQDSRYWSLPREGMERALGALSPYGVTLKYFLYDRYDRESCRRKAEELAAYPCDGIVAAPLWREETRALLERKNLPVLFFDSPLEDPHRVAFVGQDSRSGGKLAAKLMNLLAAGRPGDYLIVVPRWGYSHLEGRIAGFRERAGRRTVLFHTDAESRRGREAVLNEAIREDLGGIYVADASAHYVAECLSRRALGDMPLIGFDLVEENRKALADGVIDFILTQQPLEQGYQAVRLMYRRLMLGEDAPDELVLATQIITKENIPQ